MDVKVIFSQASNPPMPHCVQFGSSQNICQSIVICIDIKCLHTGIHEIAQLLPISNKEILIYEQGFLLLTLLTTDWHN